MSPILQQNENVYKEIYRIVKKIPNGKVATYGQIAGILERCTARMVGYAMASAPDNQNIPWQRVINSQGKISIRSNGQADNLQKALLQSEGVKFNKSDQVDLAIWLEWMIISPNR